MSSSHIKLSDWFYGVGQELTPNFYWKCNEVGGDLIDQQGNLDITEVGSVPSSGVGRGVFSSSNYFREASVVDTAAWNWSSEVGVIFSLKFNTSATNDVIFEKEAGIKVSTITKLITPDYFSTVQFEVGDLMLYGNSNIQDGTDHWAQLAVIGDEARLYINGTNQLTAENVISNTGVGALAIGIGQAGSGNEYNGTVGEIFSVKNHGITSWNAMEETLEIIRNQ